MLTPQLAIEHLGRYVQAKGYALSEGAKELFFEAESIGHRYRVDLYHQVFLVALLARCAPLRALVIRHEVSPEDAIVRLQEQLTTRDFDPYSEESLCCSGEENRVGCRQSVVDTSLDVAARHGRVQVVEFDILTALLEVHDEIASPTENYQWSDERLNVPFNTLSHIKGRYDADLWVPFDDIRRELSLLSPGAARKARVDAAPRRIRSAVLALLADNPNYQANCFIIMPFHVTAFHNEVLTALRSILQNLGFNPLRADDKSYGEDVLSNIEAYLYGCRFAVAIHDRFLGDEHNANVALEVGYCLGMKKPVCLLKERTVKALPSDLQGRIYVPFDGAQIHASLNVAVSKWLSDSRIGGGVSVR